MKALGVDYGLKNIGLAVSDDTGIIAGCLGNIVNYGEMPTAKQIQNIIDLYKIDTVVLGYPYFFNKISLAVSDGSEEEPRETLMQRKMNRLKTYLETEVKVKVDFWDESYSSKIVEKGLRGKALKRSDSEVARFILQEYLDDQVLMKKIYGKNKKSSKK